jgi:hypothetical protein
MAALCVLCELRTESVYTVDYFLSIDVGRVVIRMFGQTLTV